MHAEICIHETLEIILGKSAMEEILAVLLDREVKKIVLELAPVLVCHHRHGITWLSVNDWDMEKRRSVAKDISKKEYITYLALDGDRVVGFIGLMKKLNGSYMILDLMQVSAEVRGHGIGRKLFDKGKEEARKAGAEALYISACSSEETIAFYNAMGCSLTDSPIKEIAEDEPYDLQMICPVNSES